MTRVIDLDGHDWAFREALGQTWLWYVSDAPPEAGNSVADAVAAAQATRGWMPARVPGSVIGDLTRHGDLADPYHARNSLAAEWTKERYWIYRRPVHLPELAPGEFATVELDGVDPAADVRWDGRPLGRVEGLYHRHRLRVPDDLAGAGAHWLTITLEPAFATEPQVGFTDAVTRAIPRMGFGWDFCPRMVHQGVWRSARVVLGAVQLESVTVRPELDGTQGQVHVRTATSGAAALDVTVTDADDFVVATASGAPGEDLTATVGDPDRWWPHGLGPQSRYTVTVTARAGAASDTRVLTTAFRDLRVDPTPGAPADALGYTFVVNDAALPGTGWNWVPADAQYGEVDPAKVERLLDLVVAANGRLVRVWGGGLVESEHFYEACDARGLLVWQEFTQSSSGPRSVPSEDPAFVQHLRDEATRIVPTLVHHPSLAAWAGGNELGSDEHPLATQDSPALMALAAVVADLDPGRPWFATSPTGPLFGNTLAFTDEQFARQHDVHGPWEHQGLTAHHTLYNRGQSLAHTEFGVEGMTNRRSLEALVPEPQRWPADRTNPVYRHTGVWWINAPLVQDAFGGRLDTLEPLRRASQLLQATGLQYAVEADRRRAPRMSLVLPWQLNEPVPNAWGTFAVDWYGDPKPVYDAMVRAFADTRVTLRTDSSVWAVGRPVVEAWLWAFRDPVPGGSTVELTALDGAGRELARRTLPVADEVGRPVAVGSLDLDGPGTGPLVWRAVWRDADGTVLDDERVLASRDADWSALLDLAPAVAVEATQGGIRVTNTGQAIVVNPRLVDARPVGSRGWPVVSSDNRVLLPGESRAWGVRWTAGAERGPLGLETFHPATDTVLQEAP